jgi:DNA/RNA endonuclease YhcR with UshA esterase domain
MNGQTGTIKDFKGSWNSGIAFLTVEHEDGTIQLIYCDNAATVRALDSLFGNAICNGHTVNVEAILGKKIEYGLDECGFVLVWIRRAKE